MGRDSRDKFHVWVQNWNLRLLKNIRQSNYDDGDVENVIYGGSAGLIKFYA